jgi:hypothetical protein
MGVSLIKFFARFRQSNLSPAVAEKKAEKTAKAMRKATILPAQEPLRQRTAYTITRIVLTMNSGVKRAKYKLAMKLLRRLAVDPRP